MMQTTRSDSEGEMFRLWLFMAALCIFLAIPLVAVAANVGAPGGGVQLGVAAFILFILSIPLLSISALLALSDGRRSAVPSWLLNVSGLGFVLSTFLLLAISLPVTEMYFPRSNLIPATLHQELKGAVIRNFAYVAPITGGSVVFAWLALVAGVSFFFRRPRKTESNDTNAYVEEVGGEAVNVPA
jgi:hypothetical protein